MLMIRFLGFSSKCSSSAVDEAIVHLLNSLGPTKITALVVEDALKALEVSLDCVVSTTYYCPLSDRIDHDGVCA